MRRKKEKEQPTTFTTFVIGYFGFIFGIIIIGICWSALNLIEVFFKQPEIVEAFVLQVLAFIGLLTFIWVLGKIVWWFYDR